MCFLCEEGIPPWVDQWWTPEDIAEAEFAMDELAVQESRAIGTLVHVSARMIDVDSFHPYYLLPRRRRRLSARARG